MRRSLAVVTGMIAAVLVVAPVSAGPPSGTTNLQASAVSGTVVNVRVTIHTTAPVVPYEYAIQNECTYPQKSGSSLQHDDIVDWTFIFGGDPATLMPIDLGTVPAGSKCKVFVMHGNVVIKGTTTSYPVV